RRPGGHRDDRHRLRHRFHPGHLRHHARRLRRVHVERICHSRPAGAVLRAGRRHGPVPLPQVRLGRPPPVHRGEAPPVRRDPHLDRDELRGDRRPHRRRAGGQPRRESVAAAGTAGPGPRILMFSLSALQLGSPLSYVLAFTLPAFDAVVPVLPSETAIVALGVATAGSVDPRIAVLVALAAAGAFAGDNLAYFIGWRFSPWATKRFFSGERGAKTK